jgi:Mrp family chromosome partitioning ATPase
VSSVLGLPLLGRLWEAPRTVRRQEALVTIADPSGRLAHAYRVLRATIDSVMPQRARQGQDIARVITIKQDARRDLAHVIAVTSATSSEGRSTTVANLGVAFARVGRRVLLINADMRPTDERRTSLDRLFGLDLQLGLADVLRRRASVDAALVYCDVAVDDAEHRDPAEGPPEDMDAAEGGGAGLWVLPAGSPPVADLGDPMTSARLDELLGDLAGRFEVILLDPPPLLVSADSLELVRRADATLVVVRANRIGHSTLAELGRVLSSSPVYRMGFVLTGATEDRHTYARERFALKPARAA